MNNQDSTKSAEDLYIDIRKPNFRASPRKLSSIRYKSASVDLDADDYTIRVRNIATSILEQFGNRTSLCFEDFKEFLAKKPMIFETFASAFKEDLWLGISTTERPSAKRRIKIHTTQVLPNHSFDEDLKNMTLQTQGPSEMAGIVYKKAKGSEILERKYATLKKSLLLINNFADDKMPDGVVFMEGCYVDIIGDFFQTNKFGITLSHQNNSYTEVNLWCDSRKDRDE